MARRSDSARLAVAAVVGVFSCALLEEPARGVHGLSLPSVTAPGAAQVLGAAGAPAARFAPGRLVVKFSSRAAARARQGLAKGFGATLGDADGAALDGVLAQHRVSRVRRLFPQLEDAQGALRATAAERATRSRHRHPERSARLQRSLRAPQLENVYLLELDASADVLAAAAALRGLADVEYAEPDWLYHATATPLPAEPFVPNDRFVSSDGIHWSEGAWGQSFLDLWGVEKLRAIEAWNAFDLDASGAFEPGETRPGAGVVIAVIDTGVDYLHPDIAANIWTNPGEIPANSIDDDANGYVDDWRGWNFAAAGNNPMDQHGHGTHVAGTAAAVADNAAGVVGVAPWARVMAVAGLSNSGSGSASNLAAAVVYAAENGADVLSNSWGGGVPSSVITDAFEFAAAVGAVSVAAAGNNSTDMTAFSPANLENVIAVAALQPDDALASFSNFGSKIDIAAPGTGVLSLNARGGDNLIAHLVPGRVVEGNYLWLDGTSMACPHVSGALAVLLSRFPSESAQDLRARLVAGGRNVDAANPQRAGLIGGGALHLEASLAATPAPLLHVLQVDAPGFHLGSASAGLVVHLENLWTAASAVTGSLSTTDPRVSVADGSAAFGDIPSGATRDNALDPFDLNLDPAIPAGSVIEFELTLTGNGGFAQTHPIQMRFPYFVDTSAVSGLPTSYFLPWHVTLQDYAGDLLPDVMVIGFFTFGFFENLGGGSFGDAVPETGVSLVDPPAVTGSMFFDADNDGDRDIAIAGGGSPHAPSYLFRNEGDGTFVDRRAESGVGIHQLAAIAASDYDRDGLLDILSGNSNQLRLLHNNGDGTFTDTTTAAGFASGLPVGNLQQILTLDYDADGDPDVAGTNGQGTFLLRNQGNGTFANALAGSGIDNSRRGGSALAAGDYDGDGDVDLFVTGIGQTNDSGRNVLLRNNGNGSFTNATASSGDLAVVNATGTRGTDFFDFDNDGDLDLLLAAEGTQSEVYFHVLYRNEGDGTFEVVNTAAFPLGFLPGGAAVGIGDYDLDGSLDLYAPDGALAGAGAGGLLRNQIGPQKRSLQIDLEGIPREPYGARVRVVAGGVAQIREVHTGPVEPLPLHFGLGAATSVQRIEIRWPDGSMQRLAGVAADQRVSIQQFGVFCNGAADADADGVVDACDNCVATANPEQSDADADTQGDACNDAEDSDGDEWSNALDVCPTVFDPGQEDANGDWIGDACASVAVPGVTLPMLGLVFLTLMGVAVRALHSHSHQA